MVPKSYPYQCQLKLLVCWASSRVQRVSQISQSAAIKYPMDILYNKSKETQNMILYVERRKKSYLDQIPAYKFKC